MVSDSSIFEYQLSSRALTLAEEGAVKRSGTIEELDNYLAGLQAKVSVGTIVLFEVPRSSKIDFNPGVKMILVNITDRKKPIGK